LADLVKLIWAVLLCACSVTPKPQGPYIINHVQVDSAFADFFSEYHELLPTERVLCVYGAISNDTAWINFVKPARMGTRSRHLAVYQGCPHPKVQTTIARFLGTWHPHNVAEWDGCVFSEVDNRSFVEDSNAVLELLSCRGKLMARSKNR
jgi:hypothetical protein